MIKVIIFDLGNVILPFDFMLCCQRLAEVSPYSAEAIYQYMLDSKFVWDYEQGQIDSREFFSRLSAGLSLKLEFTQFIPIWGDIFTENREVSNLIRNLDGRYRLLLLSNTNELHFEFIRKRYPIVEHFQEHILSYRLGWAKPEPPIWEEAIRRAGVPPSQILYIDDRPEFAQAATQAGMRGLAFTSYTKLIQDLIQYGVAGK